MYHFDSAFVHSCIGMPPPPPKPPPPSSLPLLLFLVSTVAWINQLLSASVLCHFAMKRPAASTTPRYQFPLFLAALDHSTLLLLTAKRGCPLNALVSSSTAWAQFFSGRLSPGFDPHQPSSRTSPDESAAQLSSFVLLPQRGGGFCVVVSTLSHCVEGLGGRYIVVGALSELGAQIG